jgi:protein deglycase
MIQAEIVVPLAPGFEETEAVAIIDVLRRAKLKTVVASLTKGPVKGSHDIVVVPDATLDEIDLSSVRAVVLPGGMPGAANLRDDPRVTRLASDVLARGGVAAAVCAAPIALAKAGVLAGRTATTYPGFEDQLGDAKRSDDRVVVDRRVITGRGPGVALEFALAVVAELKGRAVADEIAEQMLVRR